MACSKHEDKNGFGSPVQVIDFVLFSEKPSRLVLNKKVLKEILDSVGNRPVFLISIAGASRQGKSFLLSIILNVLFEFEHGNLNPWPQLLQQDILKGFNFQNGIDRTTVGFWFWSKPFILKKFDGTEIAVLVMDTQGVFDSFTTRRDWSMVVGLSLLTSSCVLYNLMTNMQEDTLEIFNNFVEFGMLSLHEDQNLKNPFQKLVFLIRDWMFPNSHSYGSTGGTQFLEKKMQIRNDMPKELRQVREKLKTCFETVECFLMPNPGEPAKMNDYKGNLGILDSDFLIHMQKFIEDLLEPDSMQAKKIGGEIVSSKQLYTYFEKYVEIFNQTTLPDPKSLYQITLEAKLETIAKDCVTKFENDLLIELKEAEFYEENKIDEITMKIQTRVIQEYQSLASLIKFEKSRKKNLGILTNELTRQSRNTKETNQKKRLEVLHDVVQNAKIWFSEYLKTNITSTPLLPIQMNNLKIDAREQIKTLIKKWCSNRDEEFFKQLMTKLDTELASVEKEYTTINDENVQNEQQMHNKLLITLLTQYEEMLGFAKDSSDHFTEEKLEKIHKKALSKIVQSFKQEFRSNNKMLEDIVQKQFEEGVAQKYEILKNEVTFNDGLAQKEACQLVDEKVKLYQKTMDELQKSNLPMNELKLQHQMQENKCVTDLLVLHVTNKPIADKLINQARATMNKYKENMEEELRHKIALQQQELEQHLLFTCQEFKEKMLQLINSVNFLSNEDIQMHSDKFCQEAFSIVNLKWSSDSTSCTQIKSKIKINFDQQLDEIFSSNEMQLQKRVLEITNKLNDLADDHKDILSNSIEKNEVMELGGLKELHDENFCKIELKCDAIFGTFLPLLKQRDAMSNLKSDLVKIFDWSKNKLQKKLDTFSTIQEKCSDAYEKEIDYLCENLSDMPQKDIDKHHAKAIKVATDQFKSEGPFSQKEGKFLWNNILDKIQLAYGLREQNSIEQKKLITISIQELQKDLCSNFRKQMEMSMHEYLEKHNFTNFLEKKMNELSELFSTKLLSFTRVDKTLEILAFKKILQNVKTELLVLFVNSKVALRTEVEKLLTLYSGKYQNLMAKVLEENNKQVVVDPAKLHQEHKKNVAHLLNAISIEGCNNLQKVAVIEELPNYLNNWFENVKKDNQKRFQAVECSFSKKMQNCKQEFIADLEKSPSKTNLANDIKKTMSNIQKQHIHEMAVSSEIKTKWCTNLENDLKEVSQDWLNSSPNDTELELAIIQSKAIYHEKMAYATRENKFTHLKVLEEHHRNALKWVKSQLKIRQTEAVLSKLENILILSFKKYQDLNDSRYYDSENVAIGIDLGTTYSCVSIFRNGSAEMIPDRNNHKFITPSYVLFNNNDIVVGESAKDQAVLYPSKAIFDAKRLIGRKFDDELTQRDIGLWPFEVIDDNNRPKVKVEGVTFFPEQVSAQILIKLKMDAEKQLNCQVKNVVITVPANFSDAQKQATKDAGKIAKLNVLGILNEPTAAAIAYSLTYTDDKEKNVLVYDLGGGTFDVCVLSIKKGNINVKAVGGDNHLGGEDIDNNMLNYCLDQFQEKHSIDLKQMGNKNDVNCHLRRIRHMCEKQKINLSVSKTSRVVLEVIDGKNDMDVEITRENFNDFNKSIFEKTIEIVKSVMKDARIEPIQIDEIVLVGGSTRIPKIQEMLEECFPNKRANMEIDPDQVVAKGAAIFAAMKNGSTAREIGNIRFSDVAPLSIGVELVDGKFSVIIPKNTKVPVTKTEKYYTTVKNQKSVNIAVYEGEDILAKNNNLLGKFILSGIPPALAGKESVEITIACDKEGILKVSAVVNSTGGSKKVDIESQRNNLSEMEINQLSEG